MKITIITVCYNADKVIEKTIQSVQKQTYSNIEYIVIDGGSSDRTLDIIMKYEKCISNWISEPDKGVFDAMNKGLDRANGDYVIFMNAGDYFADADVIEKVCNYIFHNKGADVYHGDVYKNTQSKNNVWKAVPFYLNKRKIKGMNICHQAIFTKLDTAKKYYFDISYKLTADYDMMMKIFKNGGIFKYMELNIAVYDTTGMSSINWKQTYFEEVHICGSNRSFLYYMLFIKKYISHALKLLLCKNCFIYV